MTNPIQRWVLTTLINNSVLSNKILWGEPCHYSTIQTFSTSSEIYLLGRSRDGIRTFVLRKHERTRYEVVELTPPNLPHWSDLGSWDQKQYYSTIQAVVINDTPYLLARAKVGVITFKLISNNWVPIEVKKPPFKNDWHKASSYSTMHTIILKDSQKRDVLYVVIRGSSGILMYKLDEENKQWVDISNNNPPLSNAKNYNEARYYATIHSVSTDDRAHLLVRAAKGMVTYNFSDKEAWSEIVRYNPPWSNEHRWDDTTKKYYKTIQSFKLDGHLYVIGRAKDGIWTYKLKTGSSGATFERVNIMYPQWINGSAGWDHHSCYSTIQTAVVGNKAYLIGRSPRGIETFYLQNDRWEQVQVNNPAWSNENGWNDKSAYTTIQTVVGLKELLLIGREPKTGNISLWAMSTP